MCASSLKNLAIPRNRSIVSINPQAPGSLNNYVDILFSFLEELRSTYSQLIILCIGSDRSTGDSLGPLVGSMLTNLRLDGIPVYGTLENPVHALNLRETKEYLEDKYASHAILAVDACLGQKQMVGHLEVGKGSLLPGAAVKKRIPPIGNLFVTGIVNIGGYMELMVLQSTRLGIVFPLARFIAWGMFLAVSNWANNNY
ncbi:MAG: spore protease YyaC [Firmicutes bacterium]|jgi:putative sporulation protein YyaC|nr:spore protease YyaC [Bacillota bacterium]